jgi:hypothetical protein
VVGILENPRFRAALSGVELSGFIENFKKEILHHIFRLAWVAKDSQNNFQDQPIKAIKQSG